MFTIWSDLLNSLLLVSYRQSWGEPLFNSIILNYLGFFLDVHQISFMLWNSVAVSNLPSLLSYCSTASTLPCVLSLNFYWVKQHSSLILPCVSPPPSSHLAKIYQITKSQFLFILFPWVELLTTHPLSHCRSIDHLKDSESDHVLMLYWLCADADTMVQSPIWLDPVSPNAHVWHRLIKTS